MIVFAIDPGTERSAFIEWSTVRSAVMSHGIWANDELLSMLNDGLRHESHYVVEMIASYGMAVGAEVFETCVWIGKFLHATRNADASERLFRRDIKLHICADSRAKDANIRQALIDRFGGKERAIGRKSSPGPLYGIKGDEWSALAVAITYAETHK